MSAAEYARLAAGLPVRQKPVKDSFPTQAKAVKLWIEALPLANSGATARLLFNGLKELNQLEVDPTQRFEILELLRAPVAFIVGGMDKHVIGQPLPLPQQKRQIGSVMRDFQHELAQGYRIALVELTMPKGAVPFLRGRMVATALVRAVTHLSALFAKSYLTYAEPPPNIWHELYTLMAYGRSQGLNEKGVGDPQIPGIAISAESTFIQTMLMHIAHPYRLTQEEIAKLDVATRIWAAYCDLKYDGSGSGYFTVDPKGDRAPSVEKQGEGAGHWRLDTAGLVRHLRGQLAALSSRLDALTPRSKYGQGPSLAGELVERLVAAWAFSGEREHQRLPGGHMLDAAIGLHAAHYLVAGNKDLNAFVQSLSGGGISLTDRERSAAWAQASSEQAKPNVSSVQVQDQSLGGYRILWENAPNLRARVGELIALAAPTDADDPPDWMIGVLRWLRGGSGDTLEAGVQLLSRRAEGVALRAVGGETQTSPVIHRGLLLQPLHLNGSKQTTLLGPALINVETRHQLLRLPDPFDLEPARACSDLSTLQVVENTGAYKQFIFGLDGEEPVLAPDVSKDARPSDLDAVWSAV